MTEPAAVAGPLHLRLLHSPTIRIATALPVALMLLYPIVRPASVHLGWFAATIGAAAALIFLSGWRTAKAVKAVRSDAATHSRIAASWTPAQRWQVISATAGVALIIPFFWLALDAPTERFSPLIAVVIVAGAYSYPPGWRFSLTSWAVVVWFVTLWLTGVRDPVVWSLHVGGGAATLLAALRLGRVLSHRSQHAAEERQHAEERAAVLASVLRITSLDPDRVLQEIAVGLVDIGFDPVAVFEIDHRAEVARLVTGAADKLPVEFLDTIPLGDYPISWALEADNAFRVDEIRDDLPRLGRLTSDHRLTGVLLGNSGGPPDAVILAVTAAGPPTEHQREAAMLLRRLATQALQRARRFREDEALVAELRALDGLTQDFVSTVSHELRTPLTVVQGLGQTLAERWEDLDPDRRVDLLRRVVANVDRLGSMLLSLLSTSALESGQLEPHLAPVRLRSLVEELQTRLGLGDGSHRMQLEVPDDLWVWADANLLSHVLENLLGNVFKHTPPGTTATVRASTLEAGRIRVEVADDGPGIPAEDQPHVLERFFRGGDATTRPSGGLGLGLAIASQIVRGHGGELEVVSEPGEGTVFCFELADAAAMPADGLPPS